MLTTVHRMPFGDISNKENATGNTAGKKTTSPAASLLPPLKSNSQEDKDVENEQVRS